MRERLLIQHFLRRFLDNDLVSPHADRHEAVSVVCAGLVSSSLFVTVLVSLKYLLAPFQPPGLTAITALDDSFLYVTCSMTVMALVAVVEWEALSLDARDAAILLPLPIRRGAIVRAKLAALFLFATVFAVALNLGPSLLYPLGMVGKLSVSAPTLGMLMASHALTTTAAGLLGFLGVLAFRELARALLGVRFGGASALLQAAVLVVVATALLLAPGLSKGVAQRWLPPNPPAQTMTALDAVPPMWFVGLHQTVAGHLVSRAPRPWLPPRMLEIEEEAADAYRSRQPLFAALALGALFALTGTAVVAVALFLWNSRRVPMTTAARRRQRSHTPVLSKWIMRNVLARRPATQAGYSFCLQTLARSLPHRVAMTVAFAAGLAVATVSLDGLETGIVRDAAAIALPFLGVQTLMIGCLLAGCRHAMRVPADVRAAWSFHLSWSGDGRRYISGVKRAAFVALCLPALSALSVAQSVVLGGSLALSHLAVGVLVALVLLEALFLGVRTLPFVSDAAQRGGGKLAPLYVAGALLGAYGLAFVERVALASARGTAVFLAALLAGWLATSALGAWRGQRDLVTGVEELIDEATQLRLSG